MQLNSSVVSLTFRFLKVEERPLLEGFKPVILTLILLTILLIGLLIQARIFFMLRKQRSDGTVAAIDRLFKTHNYVNIFCQPAFIIYVIFSHYLYPMVDYVSLPGCVFFSHFLLVFSSLYYLIFPLTIAVIRLAER